MNAGRRPITDEETPHLAALGARVRELRTAAGLTQSTAGTLAALTADHIGAIERGQRRTRATTLARIVAACGAEDPAATLAELVALAGPALAPESDFAERVDRRRLRKERRHLPAAIAALAATRRDMLAVAAIRGEAADNVERLAELEADLRARLADARSARKAPKSAAVAPRLAPRDELAEAKALRRRALRLTDLPPIRHNDPNEDR